MFKREMPMRHKLRNKVEERGTIRRQRVLKVTLSPAEESIKLEAIKRLYYAMADDTNIVHTDREREVMREYVPWYLYTDVTKPESMVRVIATHGIYNTSGDTFMGVGLRCIYLLPDNSISDDFVSDVANIQRVHGWSAMQQLKAYQFVHPDAYLRAIGFIFLLPHAEEIIRAGVNGNTIDLDKVFNTSATIDSASTNAPSPNSPSA